MTTNVEEYVIENLRNGYTPESIKQALTESGQDSSIVDNVINSQQQAQNQGPNAGSQPPSHNRADEAFVQQPTQNQIPENTASQPTAADKSKTPEKRPIWVSLFSALNIFLGILYTIIGVAFVAFTSIITSLAGEEFALMGLGAGIISALLIIVGVVGVVSGVGLWKMKHWAYTMTIGYLIVETLVYLYIASYTTVILCLPMIYLMYKNKSLFSK